MTATASDLRADVERILASQLSGISIATGMVTLECQAAACLQVARTLRDHPELDFAQLTDLAGVDYSTWGEADWQTRKASGSGFSRAVEAGAEHHEAPAGRPRFAVVSHLLSISRNQRLRLRVWPEGDPPQVASLCELWPSANWYEREAFDLFGILFDGHTDLRRLLTDYGFIGHPFRKDFPLEGHVEVRYDPAKARVVYQPVTIEPRVLVPRVIRDDNRYWHEPEAAGSDNA